VELEDRLCRLLSSPDEDEATRVGPSPAGWTNFIPPADQKPMANGRGHVGRPTIVIPGSNQTTGTIQVDYRTTANVKEIAVHPRNNWKKTFALGGTAKSPKSPLSGEIEGWWEDPDDPVHALNACASAMMELWRDQSVRQRLKEKRIRLEESSGLCVSSFRPDGKITNPKPSYLDEIPRITAKKYFPTDGMSWRSEGKQGTQLDTF
jgi:guanine nucleotide-binding protein alpha-1 subunit